MKKIKKINGRYSPKHGWKMVISKMIFDYVNNHKNIFPESLKWDELLYIISKMEYKIFTKKYRDLAGDFIPFPSAELKRYKADYSKYLDFLLSIGILDKKNYSTYKKRCTKYKFNYKKAYLSGYRIFDIKNIEINRSIKHPKNDYLFQGYKDKDLAHLTKWFNDDLQFDENNFLELMPSKLTKKDKMYHIDDDELFRKIYLRIQSYNRSAEELKNKNFRMSRNKNSDNRFHTNLTNLSKKLRQFVRYKGETLYSLDIKNSQPFFIIVLIEGLINKNNNIIRNINKVYGNNNNGIVSKISSTFLSDKEFQEEFEILRKWILEGVFYDEIIEIYNLQKAKNGKYKIKVYIENKKKTITKGFESIREASKALTLRLLYTPAKKKDEHYNAFKSRFPKICDFFVFLKNYSGGKKNSYKKFPKLLQHIEADCIIDNVTKKIAKKHPHAPIFTVHDSIVTTEEYIDEFQDLMFNYISEYTNGLIPKLSKECWCADDDITDSYLEAA